MACAEWTLAIGRVDAQCRLESLYVASVIPEYRENNTI